MRSLSEEGPLESASGPAAAPENLIRSIIMPARFENLDQVREFVGQGAKDCGFINHTVYSVQLAVDEAFSNIVEHAYGGESDKKIQITCQIADDGLTILLRDCGQPFNPQEVPEPDLQAGLQDRQLGGLGLYFMRQLMDEVSFNFVPASDSEPGCNILRMVKRKGQ